MILQDWGVGRVINELVRSYDLVKDRMSGYVGQTGILNGEVYYHDVQQSINIGLLNMAIIQELH